MSSTNRNRYTLQDYIEAFPKFKKWINECHFCHRVGYSPDMPEHIGGVYSTGARQIKKYSEPLYLNDDGLCEVCAKLFSKSNNAMVTIREWKKCDAEALARLLNDKRILDNLRDGLPYPYTVSDAEFYINSCINADKNAQFCFAIVYNGEVVGSIGVFRQPNIHFRTAEMGYYIGVESWGKGIGTEAVRLVCKYVFDNTDIIRIYAEPFAENIGSCRVLEKNGFVLEGVLHKNAYKNGKIRDMKMYAKIK